MENTVRLTFVGDILCTVPDLLYAKKNNIDNFDFIFKKTGPIFSSSDYVVGNLETPIAGDDLNYTNYPTIFNSPIEFALSVKNAGINMVSAANNHSLDRGLYGLMQTARNLSSIGLDYTGIRSNPSEQGYLVKDICGLKVAFLSYTYGTNSKWCNNVLKSEDEYAINLFRRQEPFCAFEEYGRKKATLRAIISKWLPQAVHDLRKTNIQLDCGNDDDFSLENRHHLDQMISTIKDAKKHSDIVALCIHIGGQFNNVVGDYSRKIFDLCKGAGCDIIIGNHPHCVLDSIFENKIFVAHALGNFSYTPKWGYWKDGVFAENSIVVNIDIDKQSYKIIGITFSVTESVIEESHTSVRNLYDIYCETNDAEIKKEISKRNCAVISRFLGRKIPLTQIKKEYNYIELNQCI